MEDIQCGMNKKGIDIPIGIGEDTQIRKAIVDKNARIGKNVLVCKIQEIVNSSKEQIESSSWALLTFILKLIKLSRNLFMFLEWMR